MDFLTAWRQNGLITAHEQIIGPWPAKPTQLGRYEFKYNVDSITVSIGGACLAELRCVTVLTTVEVALDDLAVLCLIDALRRAS
jgi:hypothetical protein